MLKRTAKCSLIPDVVKTLDTLLGNEDNNKSKVLPIASITKSRFFYCFGGFTTSNPFDQTLLARTVHCESFGC